jgi:formylmethanofuran dehydrogenase subunit E
MKTIVTMSLDQDIAKQFNQLYPGQRSSFCNEQMRVHIRAAQGNLSGLKLELLLVEEKELKEKSDIINGQLLAITEKIRLIKEAVALETKQRLEKEKEELERINKCEGCGEPIGEKQSKKDINGHIFCVGCFLGDHPNIKKAIRGEL